MLRDPFKDCVPSPGENTSAGLSRRTRFSAVLAGVGLLGLLAVAGRLEPDPRGVGTHEQLGLPGCTFYVLFGKRCPACGMTTSWAQVTHARFGEAIGTHVTGTLLAVVALVVGWWALIVAARGRPLGWEPRETVLAGIALALVGLAIGEWLVRMAVS